MKPILRHCRILPAVIAALLCANAGATTIDLGPANGYSAFIFGDVGSAAASGFHDVEGRLAAGGNVYLNAFSVGQKSQAGVDVPSLVVGGSLNIGSGAIYNGAGNGKAVYGVVNPAAQLHVAQWFEAGTFSDGGVANLDFSAARKQLTALSLQVAALKPSGTVVFENSGATLIGNKNADVDVFNIDSSALRNLTLDLSSIKSTAHIIINDSAGNIDLSGGYASFSNFSERTLFNFSAATDLSLSTYAWGSILAPLATFSGSGHLEGSLVANSVLAMPHGNSTVEIGALPFLPVTLASPVPETANYALLPAGLGLLGYMLRRRKAA